MREIKFRQPLRDKQGKFIEWFYWGFIDVDWIQWATQQNGLDTRKESQQFTGLTDKGKADCYEWDILENTSGKRGVVVFYDGCFRLQIHKGETSAHYITMNQGYMGNKTIIGNIYTNPELLTT